MLLLLPFGLDSAVGCDQKDEHFACRFLFDVFYMCFFQNLLRNDVQFLFYRYELPGIHGLNFVLKNSLGGGGIASLRSDPQACIKEIILM